MTKVYQLQKGLDPASASAQWLTKLDRGISNEEEAELRAWLAEDEANRTQFLTMAKLWDDMNSLAWLADLSPEPKLSSPNQWRIAAALLVLLVAGVAGTSAWLGRLAEDPAERIAGVVADQVPIVYETAVGEQSSVRLTDGTEITLNTNSQVHVRLTKHHRLLTLLRGEAHVKVASDPDRPLSLLVRNRIIQALGTAFSVELDRQENIELVVTEGSVRVGSRPEPESSGSRVITPILPTSSTTVEAGQELIITANGSSKQLVAPEEIAARLSWRQGNLIFRGESLEEALQEVSKYTTVEFVFLNDSIKREPIAGRYKAGDIETLLAVLRENVGVAYERTDDNQVLLSKQN